MNFLIALKYFGVVFAAVIAVEETVAAEVPGTTKKQIIIDSIKASLTAAGTVIDPKLLAVISTLIDGVVTTLNLIGLFTHKAKV